MAKRLRARSREDLSELAIRSLALLGQRRLSAEGLGRALGVSTITAKRLVGALRAGGYRVSSARKGGKAWFEVHPAPAPRPVEEDPLLTTVVGREDSLLGTQKPEDADYDRD